MQALVTPALAGPRSEARMAAFASGVQALDGPTFEKRYLGTINDDGSLNTQKVRDNYSYYATRQGPERDAGRENKWGNRVAALNSEDDHRAFQISAYYEHKNDRLAEGPDGVPDSRLPHIQAWSNYARSKKAPVGGRRPPSGRPRRGPNVPVHPRGPLPLPGRDILGPHW